MRLGLAFLYIGFSLVQAAVAASQARGNLRIDPTAEGPLGAARATLGEFLSAPGAADQSLASLDLERPDDQRRLFPVAERLPANFAILSTVDKSRAFSSAVADVRAETRREIADLAAEIAVNRDSAGEAVYPSALRLMRLRAERSLYLEGSDIEKLDAAARSAIRRMDARRRERLKVFWKLAERQRPGEFVTALSDSFLRDAPVSISALRRLSAFAGLPGPSLRRASMATAAIPTATPPAPALPRPPPSMQNSLLPIRKALGSAPDGLLNSALASLGLPSDRPTVERLRAAARKDLPRFFADGALHSVLGWMIEAEPPRPRELSPAAAGRRAQSQRRAMSLFETYDAQAPEILRQAGYDFWRVAPAMLEVRTLTDKNSVVRMMMNEGSTPESLKAKVERALRRILNFAAQAPRDAAAAKFVSALAKIKAQDRYLYQRPYTPYLPLAPPVAGDALDVGSVIDAAAVFPMLQPGRRYLFLDISPFMIELIDETIRLLQEEGSPMSHIQSLRGDVLRIERPEKPLSLIHMKNMFHYVPGLAGSARRAGRFEKMLEWLAPGGQVIISGETTVVHRLLLLKLLRPIARRLMARGWGMDLRSSPDDAGWDRLTFTKPGGASFDPEHAREQWRAFERLVEDSILPEDVPTLRELGLAIQKKAARP